MNGDPVNLLHDYSYTSHKVELGIPGYRRGVRISPTGRAYVLCGACGKRLYENNQQRGAQVITQGHEYTLASNGEVEGPDDHARQAPRAHNLFPRPRRQTAIASRPPPTIVRRHR